MGDLHARTGGDWLARVEIAVKARKVRAGNLDAQAMPA